MKKIALSLGLLAGVAGAANAQTAPRFGLKAGVVAANVNGKDADARFGDNTQNRFGFQAGITTTSTIGVGNLVQFHPELLYSQKGFQYKQGGANQRTTLHYLDVPLLMRLNAAGLLFEAGPQAGYRIGQSTKGDVGLPTGNTRRFDLGYVVGVGYELASGPNIGVRYNGGLRSLYGDARVLNSVFQFQLGFAFPGRS
ncbi:porin family protein [Hymenobacter sp. B1770]|uniref:porin family protein n=1 Tax=Hymenobacter sp. B1770 TaxID=1718788 RepID=UPI003CE6F9B1